MFINRIILFLVALLYLATANVAQEVITTKSGQFIVLYEDGTWEKASTFSHTDTSEIITHSQIFEAPKESNSALTSAQQDILSDLLSDIELIEAESRVQIELINYKLQLNGLELALAKEQNNREDIDELKKIIKITKESRNIYEDLQDDSADIIKGLKKMQTKGSKHFLTDINKIKLKANEKLLTDYQISEYQDEEIEVEVALDDKRKDGTSYDIVDFPRGQQECLISFDDYDPTIEDNRKTTAYLPYFSYTHPKTKSYFKTKDFLYADVSLERVGKYHFVNLKIKMNSKDASKTYGYIRKDDQLKIEFINGRRVYGQAITTSEGRIEPYSGATIYSVIYKIDKSDFKDISNQLVDNVGIIWSSGYEEYPIYQVDLLKNQALCLMNNIK